MSLAIKFTEKGQKICLQKICQPRPKKEKLIIIKNLTRTGEIIYIYIEDNKYYLNNIIEKVIPKSKTKFLQNFF